MRHNELYIAGLNTCTQRRDRRRQKRTNSMRRLSARRNRPATSPLRRAQSRTASSTVSPSGEVVISSSLRSLTRAQ
jgi:hypothetical protein